MGIEIRIFPGVDAFSAFSGMQLTGGSLISMRNEFVIFLGMSPVPRRAEADGVTVGGLPALRRSALLPQNGSIEFRVGNAA